MKKQMGFGGRLINRTAAKWAAAILAGWILGGGFAVAAGPFSGGGGGGGSRGGGGNDGGGGSAISGGRSGGQADYSRSSSGDRDVQSNGRTIVTSPRYGGGGDIRRTGPAGSHYSGGNHDYDGRYRPRPHPHPYPWHSNDPYFYTVPYSYYYSYPAYSYPAYTYEVEPAAPVTPSTATYSQTTPEDVQTVEPPKMNWVPGHYEEVPMQDVIEGETVEVYHPAVYRRVSSDGTLDLIEKERTTKEPKIRIVLNKIWVDGHYEPADQKETAPEPQSQGQTQPQSQSPLQSPATGSGDD